MQMSTLAAQSWSMKVPINRKRSRLALDDDEAEQQRRPEPSPAPSTSGDALKKTRTQGELEELDMIKAEDAWNVDINSILASRTLPTPTGSHLQAYNNVTNFKPDQSIIILCVQGNVQVHYDLLCSMLPDLYEMSPSLQALVLCRDPSTHTPSAAVKFSLPLIQAVGPGYNHFVRLGLLHPLGGGEHPLDALVVVDARARRRLVLPFGWGAGRHVATPAGRIVRTQLGKLLRQCVETLAVE